LGRKVIVLGDQMGSSYRIKDNQLLEVNRQMKESRFTITILKNDVTSEKKYLPSSYVVNTWQNSTNQLLSSWSYHHTWKRLGKVDLPQSVTILIAKAGPAIPGAPPGSADPTLDVWTLTFADLDLLPWKG